jgi:hypothetical protein
MKTLGIGMLLVSLSGCGAGSADGRIVNTAPQAKPREAPAPTDAWSMFKGDKHPLGKIFRVLRKPSGIDGVQVVVQLLKVDWQTMDAPGGTIKTATANLHLQKGDDERNLTIEQGETRTALGVKLTLVGAGDDYDKTRMTYDAWVDLKAEAPEN